MGKEKMNIRKHKLIFYKQHHSHKHYLFLIGYTTVFSLKNPCSSRYTHFNDITGYFSKPGYSTEIDEESLNTGFKYHSATSLFIFKNMLLVLPCSKKPESPSVRQYYKHLFYYVFQ